MWNFFWVHRRNVLTIIPERSAFGVTFFKSPIFFIVQWKQIFFSLILRCCIRQKLHSLLPSVIAGIIILCRNRDLYGNVVKSIFHNCTADHVHAYKELIIYLNFRNVFSSADNTDLQTFTFFFLAETKCANSYVNWADEQENHNENASLATVFELSSLTFTTSQVEGCVYL
jgi:hypothetical protein